MPIIHAEIWKGESPEIKQALAQSLTQAAVTHLGCPPQVVTVILEEVDKANWFAGGKDSTHCPMA